MSGWKWRNPPNTQFRLNRDSPQARGLVAWWPSLGNRGSNILIDLIATRNATITGATWQAHPTRGLGINFSGLNQYATAPTVPINGNHTLSLWVMFDQLGTPGNDFGVTGIFGKGEWGNDGEGDTRLVIIGTDLSFHTNDIRLDYAVSNLSVGVIYHIVGVYRSTGLKELYINGRQVASTAMSGDPFSNNTKIIAFGAYPGNLTGTELDGTIYEAGIYERALSATEIWKLYTSPWELYEPIISQRVIFVAAAAPAAGILRQMMAHHGG